MVEQYRIFYWFVSQRLKSWRVITIGKFEGKKKDQKTKRLIRITVVETIFKYMIDNDKIRRCNIHVRQCSPVTNKIGHGGNFHRPIMVEWEIMFNSWGSVVGNNSKHISIWSIMGVYMLFFKTESTSFCSKICQKIYKNLSWIFTGLEQNEEKIIYLIPLYTINIFFIYSTKNNNPFHWGHHSNNR